MTMTNEEIVREYRAAKSRMKQIGILADENGVDSRTIVNILIEEGESVPGNFLPRRKKTAPRTGLVELGTEEEMSAPKESFELDTTNPPLIRKEITVSALIDALRTIPGDAIIMEGFNQIKMIVQHDLSTGMSTTLVSIGRAEQ